MEDVQTEFSSRDARGEAFDLFVLVLLQRLAVSDRASVDL